MMSELAGAMLTIGILSSVVGTIWLIIVAFKQSRSWGIATLLVPPTGFVFVFKYWKVAWKPFALNVASMALLFGAFGVYVIAHPGLMSSEPIADAMKP